MRRKTWAPLVRFKDSLSECAVHWTVDNFSPKCLKKQYAGCDDMKRARGHAPDRFVNHSSLCQFLYQMCAFVDLGKESRSVWSSQKHVVQRRINWWIRETFPLSRTILMGLLWHTTAIFFGEFLLQSTSQPVFWSSSFSVVFFSIYVQVGSAVHPNKH